MPYSRSFHQIRKTLTKAIPDPRKREFILGYLEGHSEKTTGGLQISHHRLNEALHNLEKHHESSEPIWRQILPTDIAKIRKHLNEISTDKPMENKKDAQ
jgi:hypothetical protein